MQLYLESSAAWHWIYTLSPANRSDDLCTGYSCIAYIIYNKLVVHIFVGFKQNFSCVTVPWSCRGFQGKSSMQFPATLKRGKGGYPPPSRVQIHQVIAEPVSLNLWNFNFSWKTGISGESLSLCFNTLNLKMPSKHQLNKLRVHVLSPLNFFCLFS